MTQKLSFSPEADDPLGRNADLLFPDGKGLVVILVHRSPELVGREPVSFGEQFPGPVNRLHLEVVAEGEVAEHLEEGMVPPRCSPRFRGRCAFHPARTHFWEVTALV
jgi:hypothetical protein